MGGGIGIEGKWRVIITSFERRKDACGKLREGVRERDARTKWIFWRRV